MLQREFKEKDVQRLRNIVQNKYGDKTTVQSGYSKAKKLHKEGDTWEENGRQWTIKNGIKQTVSKLDELKQLVVLPLTCPSCGTPMKSNKQNKQMFYLHKKCFKCVIKHETELKRLGKYDEYENNIMTSGLKTHIKELEEILLDMAINNDESFITEAGDIEVWKGGNALESVKNELKEYIEKLKSITN